MMEDDNFTKFAVFHLRMKVAVGFIAGIVLVLFGIGVIIFSSVICESRLVVLGIGSIIIGLIDAPICGYFVFRRRKATIEDKTEYME